MKGDWREYKETTARDGKPNKCICKVNKKKSKISKVRFET